MMEGSVRHGCDYKSMSRTDDGIELGNVALTQQPVPKEMGTAEMEEGM
jgi:hypothetical protein